MDPTVTQHAVCIPFPSQGHIYAMLQLAKLLHSRGVRVTFVHTESNYNRIGGSSTEGLDGFRFETIPDGPTDRGTSQDFGSLLVAIRKYWSTPFRELVKRLNEPSSGAPPPTCIVFDVVTSFAVGIAAELDIPGVAFCSLSACGYMSSLHTKQLVERGLVPLTSESDFSNGYLDTPIDWIPGLKDTQLKHQNRVILTTDPKNISLNFVIDELQESSRATAIIINTFEELEHRVLEALSRILPPIYSIGPLTTACRRVLSVESKSVGSSLWKEDAGCLKWLEGKEVDSVLYVNFGSLAIVTNDQLVELAWGVADSGYDFVWAMRPGLVSEGSAVLPEEFFTETRGRGLVMSWCPQEEVLMHRSVGGFLTHCGWNSVMESVSAGVPMVCWPLIAEQGTNCLYMCEEWGIGVEIGSEVRRENVAEVVRDVMGSCEMRRKALKWKESAAAATDFGGTSFRDLERVVKEVLLRK